MNETINAMIESISGWEYHLQNGIGGYSEVRAVHIAMLIAIAVYIFFIWWLAFQRAKGSLIGKMLDASIMLSVGLAIYIIGVGV